MNEKIERLILEQIGALRSDLHAMNGEVVRLRDEIADLRIQRPSAEKTLRELWEDGLASGEAGDMDEVFDRVIKTLNPAGSAM